MTFGSNVLDEIRRHTRDCKTCKTVQPSGLVKDSSTQRALKQCATYAQLHREWTRWVNTEG